MAKIKVEHFAAAAPYLYVIDEEGRIWRRAIESDKWTPAGEIPDEPAPTVKKIDLDLSGLPDEPHDSEHTLSGVVPEA